MLDKFFHLSEHNTTVGTEVLAGLTTFLTMAYIIFVNPSILAKAGMDQNAVFVATCVAAAIGTLIMGLYANYPVAMAPGMGLNAFFTFGVVGGMGHTWQVALGAVFLSGLIFLGLSILPVREWIINSIPKSLKLAIGAGIGLFLGMIGFQSAGLTVDHPATLVDVGKLTQPTVLLAALGFVLAVVLSVRKVPGALILSILIVAAIGWITGLATFNGIAAMPPDPSPTFLQMDVKGAMDVALISVIFAFLFVDLFDTAGTLVAVGLRAKLIGEDGKLPRLDRALIADSTATVAGAVMGTSTTTSYIESIAGINAGGRTGLTAVTTGILFLAALFLAPLATSIPAFATAPALIFVACLMVQGLADLEWDDLTEVAPAVITAIAMPFTFKIADAIGMGFIAFAVIKLATGKSDQINAAVWTIAAAAVAKFIWL